ncbi:MAG: transposase, partial [Anaerorhabdus sp.]|uniref:transposase n=1 Tax=Anaerorhabdus sp. TaxID=1872524 RepID=UPI002FCB5BE0
AFNFHISNTEVIKIFDSFVNINRISLPRILCIDEIHIPMIAYSSVYVCVMMDFQTSNLIEILPTRFKVDLLRYFDAIPMEERNVVKYVCIDMWEPYKDAVNRRFKSALVLIDSFHVIEHLTRDFTSLRIRIMNHYGTNSNEYYLLKKWNWLLIKKSIELDNQSKLNHRLKRYVNLRQLLNLQLDISPELHKAYDLMNRYLSFNDLATENDCRIQLNEIIHEFILADIPEYSEFIALLQTWKEEIINSFVRVDGKRISNGPMESLNGRIDKLEANANGVRNYKRFRNRTIYCFNKTIQYKLTALYNTNKSEGSKRGHYKK